MPCHEFVRSPANDLAPATSSTVATIRNDASRKPVGDGCGLKSGPPAAGKQSVASKRKQLQDIVESSLIDIGHVQTPHQQEELCDIILDLVPSADRVLRRKLAEKIAPRGWTSPDLAWLLANDEIDIARDMLRLSPVLVDLQLVQIVIEKSHDHRMVIASREGIGASVCTALSDFQEPDVIADMLSNVSAQIPTLVIHRLTTEVEKVEQNRTALLMRRDLPVASCRVLLVGLAQSLANPESGYCGAAAERLRSVLLATAADLKEATTVDVMKALVGTFTDNPALSLGLIEAGERHLFLCALSRMCDLPLRQVELIVKTGNFNALGVLCRSVGFEPDDFVSVVHLLGEAHGLPADDEAIEQLLGQYTAICPERAHEAMQRWIRTPAD